MAVMRKTPFRDSFDGETDDQQDGCLDLVLRQARVVDEAFGQFFLLV